MSDIGKEYKSMLDELAAEIILPPLLPDDVTIGRLVQQKGRSQDFWTYHLKKRVVSGELIEVKCSDDRGMRVIAYRKAE
jgi:hypothetical protein